MSENEAKPDAAAEENADEKENLLNKTNATIEPEEVLGIAIEDRCPCCCCLCACSDKKTEHLSCFGCFPIRCAIILIGIFFYVIQSSFSCFIFTT